MPDELKTLVRQLKNCLKYNDFDDYAGSFSETAVPPAPAAEFSAVSSGPAGPVAPAHVKPAAHAVSAHAGAPAKAAPHAQLPAPEAVALKTETKRPDLSKLDMAGLEKLVSVCKLCPLGAARIKPVFGMGNPRAQIMLIGEGPGYEEDRQGLPFVGKAGQLLDKILGAMGLDRTNVYIANIAKCHPMIDPSNPEKRGNDRPPSPDEIRVCRPYLERQIELINPEFIIALGATAARELLSFTGSLSSMRGQLRDYPVTPAIKVAATYHPAALLRNPDYKRPTWDDMKLVMKAAGMQPPQTAGKE
ncbi:MAG: uracil-DNA glycosylase [Elusimicrobiaceae bacterium]|nr:uracil-DNA glycosylase [Elusimicrobiaceae bacterium]